jgi:hypothetical protein
MSSSFPFSLSEFKHSVRDTFFKGKVSVAMENVVSELENAGDNLTDAINTIAELIG